MTTMAPMVDTEWLMWHSTPGSRVEPGKAVHVWSCNLDDKELDPYCDEAVLSAEEQDQAQRQRAGRKQWIYRRRVALGRSLLGRFLDLPPASLHLSENELGEPVVLRPAAEPCRFSTSHSEGFCVLAISNTWEVGVDMEVVLDGWDWQAVAEMYLDQGRMGELRQVPEERQQETFLRFWALHEAFARLTGSGIMCETEGGVSPEQIWDLVFESAQQAELLLQAGWRWHTQTVRMGDHDTVFAVAARQPGWKPPAALPA